MRNGVETRHKNLAAKLQKLYDEQNTDKDRHDIIEEMIKKMRENGQTEEQNMEKGVEYEFMRIGKLFFLNDEEQVEK